MPRVQVSPWAAARRRAQTLRERHAFAEDPLTLYLALLGVWEQSWELARDVRPEDLAPWAAGQVFPEIVAVSVRHGPDSLAAELSLGHDPTAVPELLAAWLAGQELVPVERYLAMATLRGPLAAVDQGIACAGDPAPRGERRCPRCGGAPQRSVRTDTGDNLVSGSRQLQCVRCGHSWSYSGSSCAYCGESGGARRTVYTEQGDGPRVGRRATENLMFPHVRAEACASCRRYLIDIDLGRDPRAVPEVDELAALPLDLHAAEQGFSKITPNVMGW